MYEIGEPMKTILSHSTDPYYNLAWEEYILKHVHSDEDILLLWQNTPSVIVGRNQVIHKEVNVAYCETHDIPILRRLSGGGTVYHDLGNLNFSVITNNYQDVLSNYQHFTKPIIDFLNHLGIKAMFRGKSDLVIDTLKFSGNAQFYYQKRMLHHGTILFNTNLNQLSSVIKPKTEDIQSIGVHSNRTTVTNVTSFLNQPMTMAEFKSQLLEYWIKGSVFNHILILTPSDLNQIDLLKQTKYLSWAWTYGESPNFDIIKTMGDVKITINVVEGLIDTFSVSKSNKTQLYPEFKGIQFSKKAFLDHSMKHNMDTSFINLITELFD